MPIASGSRLGQYEVQDFIGQGAMGLVYRAYHPQLERTGAVKVMQAISPDADTVARFRHEAQAIAKMRHPNIVDVYDFGEFEGTPYMIVEYVPGGSLANRMADGPLDRATALKYLRGIAAGLDYAHSHGVVHRDVKPANVLLTDDDSPVLADFGLAKLLQGSSLKSMTGVTTGTPAYMAPEQVTGSRVGPPADRYSLATIAYEMLTGVIPFDGQALMELLYAQVHRDPSPPSARDSSLGPRVDAVVMRGLAKDPAARWESCTAFVDALAAALAAPAPAAVERTVVMSPFGSTVPIATAAVAAAHAGPPTAFPSPPTMAWAPPVAASPPAVAAVPKKKRRHLWRNLAIGAAGLIVLVLALGVCLSLVATTISLSPTTATPGQDVQVTASHVPAHQQGNILLHSTLRSYPFVADGNGNVNLYISLPRDIPLGSHTVEVCWNLVCHAHATLQVIAGAAAFLPTPSPSSSPSPSPSASSSPHGSTPTPTLTPKPTPTPPVVSVTNFYIKVQTGSETVAGLHFAPGSTITVTFKQQGPPATSTVVGTATASSSGYWSVTFTVPKTAVVGYAVITACGTVNGCYDQTVRVTT